MFELYCPSSDMINAEWQIRAADQGAFAGDFISIVRHCMQVIGISQEDLDIAVSEMCKQNHYCAQFGIYKHCIYTYNREEKKRVG